MRMNSSATQKVAEPPYMPAAFFPSRGRKAQKMKFANSISVLIWMLVMSSVAPVLAQTSNPTTFKDLEQQVLQHRAIEAVIWGMPAVNRDLMYQAMLRETKGRDNQLLYWSRLLDWKNQTLTPNTDVIYLTPYFDTKEVGPVVR